MMISRSSALLVLVAMAVSGCSQGLGRDATWNMLAPGLPPQVSPKWAILNVGYYALKQTHEPLFRLGPNGEFSSEVLANWSRSQDSSRFRLCPKAGARFSPERQFDAEFLADFLRRSLKRLSLPGAAVMDGDCVNVSGLRDGNRFLELFSKMENAPSITSGNASAELGLGPYKAILVSESEIVLARKEPQPEGYDRIIMHAYKGAGDRRLEDRSIEDFNRIPSEDLPAWVRSEYADYGGALLKSFVLLIDHPDRRLRRTVFGCLDVAGFRDSFLPGKGPFQDIASILPLGIPGARTGRIRQICPAQRSPASLGPLVFENWKQNNTKQLERFFAGFAEKSGVPVSVAQTTEAAFVRDFFKGPRRFHLSVVSVDAVSPDYASFFGPVLGDPVYLTDVRVPRARAAYDSLLRTVDPKDRTRAASLINDIFEEEALFLPLYQDVRELYYPKGLRGISAGQDFLEYPEIGAIRR